jgi:hypothetical protein
MPKKFIKSKKRVKVNNKKSKRVRFMTTIKSYPIKRRGRTRRRRIKGGSSKNTLLPSPIINGWYDLMSKPTGLLMTYDGIEYPNSHSSNPLKGHTFN